MSFPFKCDYCQKVEDCPIYKIIPGRFGNTRMCLECVSKSKYAD